MVPKNLGCFSRSSAGEMEWKGTSAVVGAFVSKTPSSCHFFWYFFSTAIRESRFSVWRESQQMQLERKPSQTYSFQLLGLGEGQGLHGLWHRSRRHVCERAVGDNKKRIGSETEE
jgi:hypothetical protein